MHLRDNKRSLAYVLCTGLSFTSCSFPERKSSESQTLSTKSISLSFSSNQKKNYSNPEGQPIFKMDDFTVYANVPEKTDKLADDSDLYYVAYDDQNVVRDLSIIGDIVYKEEGRAVVRLVDDYSVRVANEIMHKTNKGKCGSVIRITYDTVKPVPVGASYNNYEFRKPVADLVAKVDAERIKTSIHTLEAFGTRHFQTQKGLEASQWVKNQGYGSAAAGRADVEVGFFDHSRWQQKSVIARIKGSKNPENIVIIGSHLDSTHINRNPSSAAPGADDNASGTATIMEVFRILVESGARFDYTLEFHSYAAEEAGLLGSAEIARKYREQGKNVLAMVQADMTAYAANGNKQMWFVQNNTNRNLTAGLAQLVKLYLPGVVTREGILSAGSSDHVSWNKQGYAVAFPTENLTQFNPNIHTERDRSNILDMNFAKQFGQLLVGYASHYAGLQEVTTAAPIDLYMALGEGGEQAIVYSSTPVTDTLKSVILCHDSVQDCREKPRGIQLQFWQKQGDRNLWRSEGPQPVNTTASYNFVALKDDGSVKGLRSYRIKKK